MAVAIYARISQDKRGDAAGVDRQVEECRARLTARGITSEPRLFVENDTSATKGRRPVFEQLVKALETGTITTLCVWHVDRLYRRLHDLEWIADVIKRHHVSIITVQAGDIDLSTPTGAMVAEILGAVAKAEVAHKTARQIAANEQKRRQGRHTGGGVPPFGYRRDVMKSLVPDPFEADVLRELYDRLLEGSSLGSLVRDLNDRGITTSRGGQWRRANLGQMLLRPSNAGIASHRRAEAGAGAWTPIVSEDTFRRAEAILRDPARRTQTHNKCISLLSWLAECSRCGGRIRSARTRTGEPGLRCIDGHVHRPAAQAEEFMLAAVAYFLDLPEVRDWLAPRPPDTDAVSAELSSLRTRRSVIVGAIASGDLPPEDGRVAIRELTSRISELRAHAAPVLVPDLLAGLDSTDLLGSLRGQSLDRQRTLIKTLTERIVIDPMGRGGDPYAGIRPIWRSLS